MSEKKASARKSDIFQTVLMRFKHDCGKTTVIQRGRNTKSKHFKHVVSEYCDVPVVPLILKL